MKIHKLSLHNNKNAQALIIEFFYIAIILGIVFGLYSTINPGSSQQLYISNNAQISSNGMSTLFLSSNSSYSVQELIKNNTALNNSKWNNITQFIEQRYNTNMYVLNNDSSINSSLRNCPISRFNNQVLNIPVFIYDNSTYSIMTTKFFQIKQCRGE